MKRDQLGLKLTGRSLQKPRPEFAASDSRQYDGRDDSSYDGELSWKVSPGQELGLNLGRNFQKKEMLSRGTPRTTKIKRDHFDAQHKGIWENTKTTLRVSGDFYDYEDGAKARLETENAQAQLQRAIGESHFIVTGIDAEKNVLRNQAQLMTGETKASQLAVFIEDSISVTADSVLTLGLRQTKHDSFGSHLSPRAYLTSQLSSDLTLKTGVGTGYKPPGLLEMDPNFHLPSCQGACTMIGNSDLSPEKSVSYEAGLYFKTERTGLNLTVFRADLDDMITTYFETIGTDRYRLLKNIDRARTQGIEGGASYRLTEMFLLKGNLTYTEARNLTEDRILTNTPRMISNLTGEWDFSDRLGFHSTLSYHGRRTVESGGINQQLAEYLLWNLGSSYKIPRQILKDASVGFVVENVGNHVLGNDYGYGEPGRRYFAKLNIGISE